MLNVAGLGHAAGRKVLLNDINFRLREGRLTSILGANGAGKSTLLKLLSGDVRPQRGEVNIEQRAMQSWAPRALAQKRAVMQQQQRPEFDFQVFDYLLLARSSHDETNEQALAITAEVMTQLDLMEFRTQPITRLSGGEWQRVMFARAWLQVAQANGVGGKLLLLDEPTSALDIRQQQAFFRYVSRFCALGGTVLCVLHDINTAARFADDLLLLRKGNQLAFGPVDTAFTSDHLQRCFDVEGEVSLHPLTNTPHFITLDPA